MDEQSLEISSQPSLVAIAKNIFGAFLIFILAGVLDWIVLMPEMQKIVGSAIQSRSASDWMFAAMSLIIVLFMFAYPVYLIFCSLVSVRELNRPDVTSF